MARTQAPEFGTEDRIERLPAKHALQIFVVYLTLAVLMTWPLALHLGNATPSFWGDSRLTVWVLAWDAHVLADDPTDLFQGPIFYPERDSLAYFEPHLTLGVLAAPVIWATGNPYLAHNLIFIMAFALSGFAGFLLAREVKVGRPGAVVAGAAFAFSPYWFGHIISLALLKSIACWWLPLAMLAVIRWVRTGRPRWLALATVSAVAAALTSWYLGTIVAIGMAMTFAIVAWFERPRPGRILVHGLIATAAGAVVILPFVLPYARVQAREPGYTRTLEEAAFFSARPTSFLAAPIGNRLWGPVTEGWRDRQPNLESHLFPGVVIVTLAGVGLLAGSRLSRPGVWLGGALALTGLALSLGTSEMGIRRFFPWRWLHEGLPVFRALRVPARFHMITILGLAILAALGASAIGKRLPTRRASIATVTLLVVFIAMESTSTPLPLREAPRVDPVYEELADRPGAVLELPTLVHDPATDMLNVYGNDFDYMLFQLDHWRPLANGIAGFYPASYLEMLHAIVTLPDQPSLTLLRQRGIRTLVVHTDMLDGSPWDDVVAKLNVRKGITLLRASGPILVYDIAPT